jgi:hypothetical protein
MSWLVPLVIDGGIIGGSSVIWANSYQQNKREIFPFLFVTALVLVSVVVNVSHAAAGTPLGQFISALPPLVLLGTLELVAAQHRRERKNSQTTETTNVEATIEHEVASVSETPAVAVAQAAGGQIEARKAAPAKPKPAPKATKAPVTREAPTAQSSNGRKPLRVSAQPAIDLIPETAEELDRELTALTEAQSELSNRNL